MFVIVYNNQFLTLWRNQLGDIFAEATVTNLQLDKHLVKFIYFTDLPEDISDVQIIGNKIKFIDTEGQNKELEGEVYYENGITLKPC